MRTLKKSDYVVLTIYFILLLFTIGIITYFRVVNDNDLVVSWAIDAKYHISGAGVTSVGKQYRGTDPYTIHNDLYKYYDLEYVYENDVPVYFHATWDCTKRQLVSDDFKPTLRATLAGKYIYEKARNGLVGLGVNDSVPFNFVATYGSLTQCNIPFTGTINPKDLSTLMPVLRAIEILHPIHGYVDSLVVQDRQNHSYLVKDPWQIHSITQLQNAMFER